jgi:hypothetical protein
VAGHPLPSRLVTLDPVGANVASFAGAAVLVGAILFVVGGSRLGHLLGFRPDAPLLFNPVGARVLGLLIGYPGLLVAVWALAYGLIAPHTETTALPVQGGLAASAGVLVLTGARFARFLTFQVGGRTAVEGELSKDEIVPVDEIGDDVDLAAAVQAARRGEWRPAAALLAATGDADVRADRIRVLTQQSILDSQWIEEWFAAAPDDALVTTVRAELAVQRAWAARGAMDAAHTPDEAIQAFVTGLNQAERLAERAIELAPADPMPWATLVQIARGQQVPPEEFERRLDGLLERAPDHVYGSQVALQYVCAKWFGDSDMMFGLARKLGGDAPEGSATCLLPLIAHIEEHLHLETGRGGPSRAQRHMTAGATRTELRQCVARWLNGADGGPQPGGRLEGHNLAAYAFWLADDPDAARPHLLEIGRSLTEWPWGYSGEPGEVLGVARRWAGLPVVAPATAPAARGGAPFTAR